MDVLELYAKNIIQPIEDKIKELRICYYSRNIFKYPFKRLYKELLDKYEKLWFEKLQDYEKIISEELSFQQDIEKKLNKINKK